jgi:hypothetical protein
MSLCVRRGDIIKNSEIKSFEYLPTLRMLTETCAFFPWPKQYI